MYILNVRKLLKNRLTIVIFSLMSILIILSIIIYTLSMRSNILRGSKIGDIIGRLGKSDNILNMESYYSEFEVTVISNKNTNTYSMKEWYKKGVGNKIEYIDSAKSKVTVITLNDKITIVNENQKNIMMLNSYITTYTNLLSISTFIDIYNQSIEEKCCFNANSYEKVNNINMILDNVCKMGNNCDCMFAEIVQNISKIELKLDKNSGKPLTYIAYDNGKSIKISIVYNKFDINAQVSNSIFNI